MSPQRFQAAPSDAAAQAINRTWHELGRLLRDRRIERRWSVPYLAQRAGVSRSVVYDIEAGLATSMEAVIRVSTVLGRRLELDLVDPRRRADRPVRQADVVHAAMGEQEAAQLRRLGLPVGLDEPYQHFQFAGRADLVSWDPDARALLQVENRTRFPDFQEMAGAYNAKRAYLGAALAQRLGLRAGWRSETHVIAAIWSSEVLHALRLHPESFRALCPDPPDAFAAWWTGTPPAHGTTSSLIVIDPLAAGRQRPWIGLEEALRTSTRARHSGYAAVALKLAHPE